MNPNLSKSKIPVLKTKQKKNEVILENKVTPKLLTTAISSEYISTGKLLHDSGWFDSTYEEEIGATTLIEGTMLPQKALFEHTFTLEVPESYLPFIEFELLTKPIDEQSVKGADKFTYQKLEEVFIHLYDWWGTTAIISYLSSYSEISHGTSIPPIPPATYPIPAPQGCYSRTSYFTAIYMDAGSGVTYTLSADGTMVYVGAWVSTLAMIQNWISIWNPIGGTIHVVWHFGQSVNFKYQVQDFPVPDDGHSTPPCGGTDPSGYPTVGFWMHDNYVSFFEYMQISGKTYEQASDQFHEFYPEIFITPKENGIPYKCYKRVESDIVETARKLVQITKIDAEKFKVDISGHVLLISPSTAQPLWSDPDFPTFQPVGQSLKMKLMVYFRGHPVNFRKSKEYNEWVH